MKDTNEDGTETSRKLSKKPLIHAGQHMFPMMVDENKRNNNKTPSSCPSSEKNECFYIGVPDFDDASATPSDAFANWSFIKKAGNNASALNAVFVISCSDIKNGGTETFKFFEQAKLIFKADKMGDLKNFGHCLVTGLQNAADKTAVEDFFKNQKAKLGPFGDFCADNYKLVETNPSEDNAGLGF